MGFFPTSSEDVVPPDQEPRVVGIDEDDAKLLLNVLSSEPTREVFQEIQKSPAPASELAESMGTSVQNISYHLDKLLDADAIEVVETLYSERGREMDVYATSAEPIVIIGNSEPDDDLKANLSRLLGAVGLLAIVSVIIQSMVPSQAPPASSTSGSYGIAPTATAPPIGMYVFVAGLLVLVSAFIVWYLRRNRTIRSIT